MDLIDATIEAKKSGYNYVAIDKNKEIWGFFCKPTACKESGLWQESDYMYIGMYSGKQQWNKKAHHC